ncbi:beta-defensin 110 [Fukomys damarensis]|uniref:beta-defensin 110 n=1 Tax=Fukomys damarensis TaxID=885580 RepID=UPI00053F7014|nr:beta-defensin 110 [Fukomys damarensis]
MKFYLFFFILLFWVTISPAKRRYPEYGSVNLSKECKGSSGHCRSQCYDNEMRVSFCLKPAIHCCMSSSG